MAISTILLFTIIMVSMNGITNSQLQIEVSKVPDIITTLLENITDTSTTTSMFLPHLASLLKNQEDVQRLTNLILQNKTDMCAAEDLTSILHEIFEDQQVNNNETTDLMRNYTNTITGMAYALVQMEETQSHMANDLNQSADTQTHINETLTIMASTQSQVALDLNQSVGVQTRMEETLIQLSNTLNQSVDTQHRIEDTFDQMANTQTQMANTQTQMANAFAQSMDTQHRIEDTLNQITNTQTQIANALTQVVNLLQTRNEQLPNTMATTTYMDEQLSTQNLIISLQPSDIIDCSDLASRGPYSSGSYTIQSGDNLGSFRVYCDMDTDGGGWTVFQKRFDGSVDFYRGWDAYEDGFGSQDGEYWLGLRQIHWLTRQGDWTLRIDLEDFQDNTAFAEFRSFSVGDAASHYRLTVGAYSGTAEDALTWHNNQAFSTKDSDHDPHGSFNCAQQRQGAWWYSSCAMSNLNGLYLGASQESNTGMGWWHWKTSDEVLKRSEMKIRRTQ